MYRGVIFDVDGTLYDYKAGDTVAMKNFCGYVERKLGISEENFRKTFSEARNIIHKQLKNTAASHSRVLMIQTVLELLGKNPFDYVLEFYDVYWDYFLENIRPYDGVTEFLAKLKNFGVKIAICTDMTAHIQYRKLSQLGLDKFIDFMVTSEETGMEKPAPIMFNTALKKMNIPAQDAAYIGDALDRDIQGAASVGIEPFWFIDNREVFGGDEFKKFRSYRENSLQKNFFGDN